MRYITMLTLVICVSSCVSTCDCLLYDKCSVVVHSVFQLKWLRCASFVSTFVVHTLGFTPSDATLASLELSLQ